MVSTHLKNISQIGWFPQIGMNIKKYLKPPPSKQSSPVGVKITWHHNSTLESQPNLLVAHTPNLPLGSPNFLNAFNPFQRHLFEDVGFHISGGVFLVEKDRGN